MMSFPHLFYHMGMISDVGVGGAMVAAVAPAVVRVVALRRDHPVVPTQFFEADVEALLAALVTGVRRAVQRSSPHPFRRVGIGVDHQERPVRVVPSFHARFGEMQLHVRTATTTVY